MISFATGYPRSGDTASRIIQVESGETVRISGLTIAGGNAGSENGGGIDNFGTATVSDSTFTSNTAGSGNGGLNNQPGGLLTQFDNRFLNDLPPDVFP
jgi:hypothetical protein